jgi:hypothetical protein
MKIILYHGVVEMRPCPTGKEKGEGRNENKVGAQTYI